MPTREKQFRTILNRKGKDLIKDKSITIDSYSYAGENVHVVTIASSKKIAQQFHTELVNVRVESLLADRIKLFRENNFKENDNENKNMEETQGDKK